jgi:hypothetical protein
MKQNTVAEYQNPGIAVPSSDALTDLLKEEEPEEC